jgi:hypothetical protein
MSAGIRRGDRVRSASENEVGSWIVASVDERGARLRLPGGVESHPIPFGNLVVIEQAAPVPIDSMEDLEAFRVEYGLRPDWHEPDEQEISARIVGDHLDNAMGPTLGDAGETGELNVLLTHDGQGVAVVNLATLLSWGCAS